MAGRLSHRAALVELHREQGEEAGIVTPYGVQAEATLEALRDVEGPGGRPLAEVGTAQRFQVREQLAGEVTKKAWVWRCYAAVCKIGPSCRVNAWTREIRL